jgi:nitronate monooxygenase
MAGGADTPALVAAVSEAGGLGSIGAAYLTPEQIAASCAAIRAKTQRPFGINLFVPLSDPVADDMRAAVAQVAPFFEELGLPAPEPPSHPTWNFEAQVAVALGCGASVVSFTFGLFPPAARDAVKARGLTLVGTATTVNEAIALERAGVDAIVTQGSEAGAHRGTDASGLDPGPFDAAMIGTLALVPQVVDAVRVPVIAAGGIMDGRGIAAVLALGAGAAQLGTAFLTCDEAGISEAYKRAIFDAREDDTRVTRAFTGRPARGIVNRFMNEVEAAAVRDALVVLPFPLQHTLTRPLRVAAAKAGRPEFLSLWAGQGLRLARRGSAAALMAALVEETDVAIRRLQSR